VTGYSIVLWSRLSIIVHSRRIVWAVLGVILFNGFVFHTALWVLQYGLSTVTVAKGDRKPWLAVLNPFERVQITVFTVQECGISMVYMWGVWTLLKDQEHKGKRVRYVLWMLFLVQAITISMDLVVCILDLAGYFTLKAIIHSWVYGLKLELEFVVLNQLVDIAKSGVPGLKSVTDDSVPESTVTSAPSGTTIAPESESPGFMTRPDWLPPSPDASEGKSVSFQLTRRMSSPAPLGIIPEGESMSLEEMLAQTRQRTGRGNDVSIKRIGVIPDP
jgi:hypothetical protein